jgi:hypothetical protein
MAVVAVLSMRMTRTVDDQLVIIDHNYFPAYVALAQANIRSVEESAYARRLLLAIADGPDKAAKVDDLRQRVANAGKASDEQIAAARRHINEQIADPLDFDDNIALARLDVRIESLQEERQRYESVLAKLLASAETSKTQTSELLAELDGWRDDFDRKIDAARNDMRRLAGAAIVGTRAYQLQFEGKGVPKETSPGCRGRGSTSRTAPNGGDHIRVPVNETLQNVDRRPSLERQATESPRICR